MKSKSSFISVLVAVLNSLVLFGSVAILAILSYEMLYNVKPFENHFFMQVQLWVCVIFMLDFWARFAQSKTKLKFFLNNIVFFIVSVPWLNIMLYMNMAPNTELYYLVKAMPLIRGAYGLVVIIRWITHSGISTLLLSYVSTIILFTYFSAIVFYSTESAINPGVHTFWNAVCWACMNVTTVGSPVAPMAVPGQVLAIMLAASGMMLFPIFTVYITSRMQRQKKGASTQNSNVDAK